MKKVLCIDYFFPPLMTGGFIGTGVIKYLPDLGWLPVGYLRRRVSATRKTMDF